MPRHEYNLTPEQWAKHFCAMLQANQDLYSSVRGSAVAAFEFLRRLFGLRKFFNRTWSEIPNVYTNINHPTDPFPLLMDVAAKEPPIRGDRMMLKSPAVPFKLFVDFVKSTLEHLLRAPIMVAENQDLLCAVKLMKKGRPFDRLA